MTTLLYIVLAIIVLIAVLGILAPKEYEVNRAITIAKPKGEVFKYLRSLKKQDEWSPWAKKDPAMEKKFTGTDGEVGALSHWKGNKAVGEGEQEITGIIEGERIESELRFLKPFKSTSDAYIDVEAVDVEKTRVVWGFKGENKFPMSIMMLFMSMDKMMGKDFEDGLQSLKSILEKKIN